MPQNPSRGLTAIAVFLFFGAVMAFLAGITLVFRGTILDHIWSLNPAAHAQLVPLGMPVGILFLLLAVALAVAATGWLLRRVWGWALAVTIIAIQLLGDFVNLLRGDFLRGGTGIIIAGTLIFYMTRPRVKTIFRCRAASTPQN